MTTLSSAQRNAKPISVPGVTYLPDAQRPSNYEEQFDNAQMFLDIIRAQGVKNNGELVFDPQSAEGFENALEALKILGVIERDARMSQFTGTDTPDPSQHKFRLSGKNLKRLEGEAYQRKGWCMPMGVMSLTLPTILPRNMDMHSPHAINCQQPSARVAMNENTRGGWALFQKMRAGILKVVDKLELTDSAAARNVARKQGLGS